MGWLARWRAGRRTGEADGGGVVLAGEVRGLRLELAERDRVIERLRADVAREREGEASRAAERDRAQRERLVGGLATPLVQLATQTELEGVDVASVVGVARSLLQGLADEGVVLVGQVGASERYDADRHEPLGELPPVAGGLVVVRCPGLTVDGVLVRRAVVEGVEAG